MESDALDLAGELASAMAEASVRDKLAALQRVDDAQVQEQIAAAVAEDLREMTDALQTARVPQTIFIQVDYNPSRPLDSWYKMYYCFEAWNCHNVLISKEAMFGAVQGNRYGSIENFTGGNWESALRTVVPEGRKYKANRSTLEFRALPIDSNYFRLDQNGKAEIKIVSRVEGEDHAWMSLREWLRNEALYLAGSKNVATAQTHFSWT